MNNTLKLSGLLPLFVALIIAGCLGLAAVIFWAPHALDSIRFKHPTPYEVAFQADTKPQEKAHEVLRAMSASEKVGQLLLVRLSKGAVGQDEAKLLETYKPSGLVWTEAALAGAGVSQKETTEENIGLSPQNIDTLRDTARQNQQIPMFYLVEHAVTSGQKVERNSVSAANLDTLANLESLVGTDKVFDVAAYNSAAYEASANNSANKNSKQDAQNWGKAVVGAVIGGKDLVVLPADPEALAQAYQALYEAVQLGNISQERLNRAVEHILLIKFSQGIQ